MTTQCHKYLFGPFEMLVVETDDRATAQMREAFDLHRKHVYSLSFWMTGSETAAEELMVRVFRRAFLRSSSPNVELLDRSLICEIQERSPLGLITLQTLTVDRIRTVRASLLRIELERAVLRLPPTERLAYLLRDAEGYSFTRIAGLLGISEEDARLATHAARARILELIVNGFR